jgi:hypothetical protein
MGFLRHRGEAEDGDRVGHRGGDDSERAESLARVESGGIPLGAERRLQALCEEGSLFTSVSV